MTIFLYLAYGSHSYCNETEFSILSAKRFMKEDKMDIKFVVYTDMPENFQTVDVSIRKLDPRVLENWSGKKPYLHRRKIMVMKDAMSKYENPVILLDTDTFFIASPQELINKVKPGHSVMDTLEGPVLPVFRFFLEKQPIHIKDLSGNKMRVPENSNMWNSGVVGIDPTDKDVLDDILQLNDQIYDILPEFNVEQFSFGCILEQRTALQEAKDIVYHYCHPQLRRSFKINYAKFFETHGEISEMDRALRCYEFRPRWNLMNRTKIGVKLILKSLGLFPRSIRFKHT